MIVHDELALDDNKDIRIIRSTYEPSETSYEEHGSQYMYCIDSDGFYDMTKDEILDFLKKAIAFVEGV